MSTLSMSIQALTTITAMQCPVCGVHYGLDEGYRARAEKVGKGRWQWYCTNGHLLGYHGESAAEEEAEELRRQLESQRGWSARLQEDLGTERRSHAATKGQLTKARKRADNGVCQHCNRHFVNVERHVRTKHPNAASTPEEAKG